MINSDKFAFVGYADILGFSEMIKDSSNKRKILEAYNQIWFELDKEENKQFPTQLGVFSGFGELVGTPWYQIIDVSKVFMISDSIFFVITPDSIASEKVIRFGLAAVRLMSRILSICWRFDLPARGALSDGKVYFDAERNIFIGDSIVRAVNWEKVQSFVWFSLDPLSFLARHAYEHPNGLIRENVFEVEVNKFNFCVDRLKKFKSDWNFNGPNKTYTSIPDHTFLEPDQILSRFKSYKNFKNQKIRRYWNNTRKLFEKMATHKISLKLS